MRKWTEADRKRAEKMGWCLREGSSGATPYYEIERIADAAFRTNREAVEWVMDCEWMQNHSEDHLNYQTCRKAVCLCCLGGEQ